MQLPVKLIKSTVFNLLALAITVCLAIPFGQYAAKFLKVSRPHQIEGDFREHLNGRPYPVTLYGTSTCKYCAATREYLRQRGIKFNDIVLDSSDKLVQQTFQRLGQSVVPVLVTSKRIVVGYRVDEVDDMLNALK